MGALTNSKTSLKLKQDESGRASKLGVSVNTLGGDRIQINDNIYDSTPEIFKALSYTGYTGKAMKIENDIIMMSIVKRDLGYTGTGDKKSNGKIFFTITLPELVDELQNRSLDEITVDSDDLQGEGFKIIIPCNINDFYTRLEVLLGLKLSVHTDILTEASNLIDELYKRGEIQNEQQYRNALSIFSP